jgi:glycerophosphoryl diester phosphodiesterase
VRLGYAVAALVPALLMAGAGVQPVQARAVRAARDCDSSHVVEHRTDPLEAPENTLPGIDAAAATGAGWVEMDVRWSKSHFPVLMHDATVDRTTNGSGNVADLGLGDLLALKDAEYAPWTTNPAFSGSNEPTVPYAWSFLNEAQSHNINLLLHVSTDTPPAASDTDKLSLYIDSYFPGIADHIVIQASYADVQAMRAERPNYRYALIEYNSSTTMRRPSSVLALGVHDYVIPAPDVDPQVVAWYHAAGITVWSWTSDTPAIDVSAQWSRLKAAGVDYVITNRAADYLVACP